MPASDGKLGCTNLVLKTETFLTIVGEVKLL